MRKLASLRDPRVRMRVYPWIIGPMLGVTLAAVAGRLVLEHIITAEDRLRAAQHNRAIAAAGDHVCTEMQARWTVGPGYHVVDRVTGLSAVPIVVRVDVDGRSDRGATVTATSGLYRRQTYCRHTGGEHGSSLAVR